MNHGAFQGYHLSPVKDEPVHPWSDQKHAFLIRCIACCSSNVKIVMSLYTVCTFTVTSHLLIEIYRENITISDDVKRCLYCPLLHMAFQHCHKAIKSAVIAVFNKLLPVLTRFNLTRHIGA